MKAYLAYSILDLKNLFPIIVSVENCETEREKPHKQGNSKF